MKAARNKKVTPYRARLLVLDDMLVHATKN